VLDGWGQKTVEKSEKKRREGRVRRREMSE
jgi:hypothetical protein